MVLSFLNPQPSIPATAAENHHARFLDINASVIVEL
jgi:hypothetical protein